MVVLLLALGFVRPVLAAERPLAPLSRARQAEFQRLLENAKSAFSRKDYRGALFLYQDAEKIQSTLRVNFGIAQCHRLLGNRRMAIKYYRISLQLLPADRGVSSYVREGLRVDIPEFIRTLERELKALKQAGHDADEPDPLKDRHPAERVRSPRASRLPRFLRGREWVLFLGYRDGFGNLDSDMCLTFTSGDIGCPNGAQQTASTGIERGEQGFATSLGTFIRDRVILMGELKVGFLDTELGSGSEVGTQLNFKILHLLLPRRFFNPYWGAGLGFGGLWHRAENYAGEWDAVYHEWLFLGVVTGVMLEWSRFGLYAQADWLAVLPKHATVHVDFSVGAFWRF